MNWKNSMAKEEQKLGIPKELADNDVTELRSTKDR